MEEDGGIGVRVLLLLVSAPMVPIDSVGMAAMAGNRATAREYASGKGPQQHRAAAPMLAGAFFTDFYALVARWADWAAQQIETWPDDPADAVGDLAELEAIAQRADW